MAADWGEVMTAPWGPWAVHRTVGRWLTLLIALCSVAALLGVAPAAHAASSSVLITEHDAKVAGAGSVAVTGETDPAGPDRPASIKLLLNGSLVSQTSPGVAGPVACDDLTSAFCLLNVVYATGSFVGSGNLVAVMTTAAGATTSSPAVAVTVVADAGAAQILSDTYSQHVTPLVSSINVLAGNQVDLLPIATITGRQPGDVDHLQLIFGGRILYNWVCDGANYPDCEAGYLWTAAVADLGRHQLWVRMTLPSGTVVVSGLVNVEVRPSWTSVGISQPADGATVSGIVHVAATAMVPTDSGDSLTALQLLVNSSPVGSAVSCGTGHVTSCSASFDWDTSAVDTSDDNGAVYVEVLATTSKGGYTATVIHNRVVAAPQPPVPSSLPPVPPSPILSTVAATTISLPAAVRFVHGASARLQGTITNATTRQPMAGVPVTLRLTPVRGRAFTIMTTTDAAGVFAVTDARLSSGAVSVTATSGGTAARTTVSVSVPVACRSARQPRSHGALVRCTVAGLPTGTAVTLHDTGSPHRKALVAKARAGAVTFALRASGAAWDTVWVTTPATDSLLASQSRHYAVRVG